MTRALLLAALAFVSACANAPEGTPKQRGAAALAAGDAETARIELLNAIKAAPDDAEARLLQAKTLIALRDGVAAGEEIAQARRLGASRAATANLLAEAALLHGDAIAALAAFAESDQPRAARGLRAEALGLMRDPEAGAAFDAAIAATPDDPKLWVALTRFRRANNNVAGAIEAADRAIALDPGDADALLLRGELTRVQYGLAAAMPWFDRAIEERPKDVVALLERAATAGELGWTDRMLADTRAVQALQPGNARAYFLQAVLAARAGNYPLARSLHDRTRGRFDRQPAALLLAGALDLQAGNHGQAARRLAPLVEAQPGNRAARRLLAAAETRRGDALAAFRAIQPVADRPDADSYSLTLMARALLAREEPDPAAFYLARAARPPAPPQPIVPPGASPEVAAVASLLAAGDVQAALGQAIELQRRHPGVPHIHVLAGDVRAAAGDPAGAAADYRAAANLAFTEPVALRLVEALDRNGEAEAARDVLALFLAQNPRSIPALGLAADRRLAARDFEGAIEIYEGLRARLGNGDALLLADLAWAWHGAGDSARALSYARAAHRIAPGHPAVADTYGWLLHRTGARKAEALAALLQSVRGPDEAAIRARLAKR